MVKRFSIIIATIMVFSVSLGSSAIPNNVTLRDFFPGLTFSRPVHMVQMPGRDSVYVVVEQEGTLQLVQHTTAGWTRAVFATISVSGGGGEDGLLGLAFHPRYSENKKYYTYFLRNSGKLGDYVAERLANSTLLKDSAGTERILLNVADPAGNHNGGTIAFGKDGFLYVGLGDGGPQNDPAGRAQNGDSLLGKILRIDVNSQATGLQYGIPTTNPFIGRTGFRGEIWAIGFRNPYRWCFHPATDELWVGDVGQDDYEEIDFVPKGGNLGWKVMEGLHCRPAGPGTCDTTGLIKPVVERPHSAGERAIIGGVFFQGDPTTSFHNVYFFGDNSSGKIWAMRVDKGKRVEDAQVSSLGGLSSFATDSHGRVFAMSVNSGTIRVLESPDMKPAVTAVRPSQGLQSVPQKDLLNRGKYQIHKLDGSRIRTGKTTGLVVATKKNGKGPAHLVPILK